MNKLLIGYLLLTITNYTLYALQEEKEKETSTLHSLAFAKLEPQLQASLENFKTNNDTDKDFQFLNSIQDHAYDLFGKFINKNFEQSKSMLKKLMHEIDLDNITDKTNSEKIMFLEQIRDFQAPKKFDNFINGLNFNKNIDNHIMKRQAKIKERCFDSQKLSNLLILSRTDTLLKESAYTNNAQFAKTLLHFNAKPNYTTARGSNTPLHVTAINNSDKVAAILLAHGADVNARNSHGYGDNPLNFAMVYNATNVIPLLIEAGADVNIIGNIGNSAQNMMPSKDYHIGKKTIHVFDEALKKRQRTK